MTEILNALLIALMVLNLLDWWTTRVLLRDPRNSETNVVLARVIAVLGLELGLLVYKLSLSLVVWRLIGQVPESAFGVVVALVALYAVVVASNWRVSRGLPGWINKG